MNRRKLGRKFRGCVFVLLLIKRKELHLNSKLGPQDNLVNNVGQYKMEKSLRQAFVFIEDSD